jgi:prepilin-type N-terminal cleavage/methylation domain-containing protein
VRNRRVKSSGFTLIELLLVMVILTIMVAIAAPRLAGFAIGRKTQYAAVQLVALAKYARTEAVNEGRTYRLNFDTAANPPAVWLTVQRVGQQFDAPPNSWGHRVELADGLTLRTDIGAQPANGTAGMSTMSGTNGANGTYIEFHPDGRTGDGPVHVWINDREGRAVEMACLSPTELFRVLAPDEMTQ